MISRQLRKRLRNIARALQPWIDTRTYRPLFLLFVVALAALLGPPLYDTGMGFFLSLPRRVHWALGEGVFLLIVATGLLRLLTVKPADTWPLAATSKAAMHGTQGVRSLTWALRLTVASLILPTMRHPDGLGFADWDFVLDKFEAIRRTILIWGQFPWWNPWCRGGFPLAAEPQIGAVSIATPLVLSLGTAIGLRVAAILCLLIAVEGAYRLASLWLGEPWAAAAVGLVYGLNGAVITDTSQGYILAMSYCSVPWLVYHAFRIGDRFLDGLALGFWLAFAVLNGIHYLTLYGGVLTMLVWMRALRVGPRRVRSRVLVHAVAALGLCLALCGWRLATALLVMRDDQREQVTRWDESPWAAFGYLLARPASNWYQIVPGQHHADYISRVSYVGPVVVVLALASLSRRWRWWHTLTLITGWLAIGSVHWYHASYWLSSWPFFGSAYVVIRWRYLAFLGISLAAGSVLARWRRSDDRRTRLCAACLTLVVAVDYVSLAYQQLPLAFSIPADSHFFPGPPVPTIVNVREGKGYPCTLRGYGVIRGYEPMLSYRRNVPTLRKSREDIDYRGEAWTSRGPIEPVYWSPNRLVFLASPGQEVFVNQNPGSWWWANGRLAFARRRCAELMVPFVARADDAGRLELEIRPPGLKAGIGLQFLGLSLLCAASLIARAMKGPDAAGTPQAEGSRDLESKQMGLGPHERSMRSIERFNAAAAKPCGNGVRAVLIKMKSNRPRHWPSLP